MKELIKKIIIFIYNLMPSKKIKKYIRKKVIFSNKLSNIFLYEEKNFIGYRIANTKEYTKNINYLEKKVIIDLFICNNNYEKIYNLLNEINIDFDLNIHSKKNINIKKYKKILYLNKITINKKIDYANYMYYIRIDESTFNSYDKYIINNSIELLKRYSLPKLSFSIKNIKNQSDKYQKEFEKQLNIPEKNILLYNSTYKLYESDNFIVNLLQVDKKYIGILENKKLPNSFFHKVIDLVYKNSIEYGNNNYNYIKHTKFKYLDEDKFNKIIQKYEILSFDIFDTLICRKIYNPDDIFYKIEELTNIKNYIKYRKKAEEQARELYKCDVNIYQIYDEFQKILKLTEKEKNKCLNYEIDMEIELCHPREKMKETIKKLKKEKKIILVSDMYLTKDIIEKMIIKCGYKNLYDELYVSNEYNARKDTGELFDIVLEKYSKNKIIHIGDNKISDGNMPINKGIDSIVIPTYKSFNNNISINNYGESICYGTIINIKLFNSPFINEIDSFNINSLEEFGYTIFGPIFLKFITWINNNAKKEKYLLVSREGHFLTKLFEYYSNLTKTKLIDNCYFLTSRRSTTVPNFKTKRDVIELLDIQYTGTLKDLLFYRIGYIYNGKNKNIQLPEDREEVVEIINKNIKEILDNAKKEKNNYIKYINDNIKNWKQKELCIVDLGYSGTVQYHLTKMLDKKINGKYFLVSTKIKPLKIGCKVESCLNEKINNPDNINNFIYQNALLLEAFLTAPHGQLRCFNDDAKPIFYNSTISKEDFKLLDKIYIGITNYFKEIYELLGKNINDYKLSNNNIIEIYKLFFMITKNLPEEFYRAFKIEDLYCTNKENLMILNKK